MFCKALSSKIQTSIKISSYFSTKLSVSYLFCSSVIKKPQTVRCSSHSNGFQNMSIIALRRQCKCYFKYFFQMSSNFFVFWQIPACDHLNETFLAAPSFRGLLLLLLFLYICCCCLLLYRFIYNMKVSREMYQWIQSKDWNFKTMDQSRAPQSLCSIMNGIFSIIVNLLALKNHICWDTHYANLELATGYVRP